MKKVIIGIIVTLLIIILLIVGCGFWYVHSKLGKINQVQFDTSKIEVTEGVKENLEGYRNIALLGIDAINGGYEDCRTDCIIIARINEKTKEVKLISVYRDTYLEIPGKGLDKVNHAYTYGGPELTLSALNTNLDLNIAEFALVNFIDLKDIVQSVGGIHLTIDADEVKHIPGIEKAGDYDLNAEQALAYARIRKEDGGDYKRTERMRTVLMTVLEKTKTMNIAQLNQVADEVLPKIHTNISTSELLSLLPQIASYKVLDNIGWPYITQGKIIDGVWYGPPITLESNVKRLHQEMFGEQNYEPSNKVKNISDQIIEKTGYR